MVLVKTPINASVLKKKRRNKTKTLRLLLFILRRSIIVNLSEKTQSWRDLLALFPSVYIHL